MEDQGYLPKGLDIDRATRLANSEAGQALLAHLQAQHGATLEAAISQAQAGDYKQVQETINALLKTPQGKALLQQLRGTDNG